MPAHVHDLADPAHDDDIEPCDLLWASPPCQPFTAAGKGDGEFDDRDGFPWTLRIIARLLPPVVIIENVKGVTFDKHAEYFSSVLRSIAGLGYRVDWRVLNSADYGVPQTRERCFIVARRDGGPIVWPMPTHTEEPGMFTEPWVTMAQALGWTDDVIGVKKLMGAGMVEQHGERPIRAADEPAFAVRAQGGGRDPGGFVKVMLDANADRGAGVRERYGDRPLVPVDSPAPCMTTRPDTRWRWVLHRGNSDKAQNVDVPVTRPAPTVTAAAGSQAPWSFTRPATTIAGDTRVFQPGGHHEPGEQSENAIRLTIAELARLQDFPDGYVWHGTKTDQARQIGNAVCPTMARVLAEANQPQIPSTPYNPKDQTP